MRLGAAVAGACLVTFLAWPAVGHAQDMRSVDDTSAQEVVDGMANKLVRGVANVGTGIFEVPKQIKETIQTEGVGRGLTVGPIKGIGMALVRTLGGAGEVLTFFIPYPGFYAPYVDPPYVWQKD